MDFFDFSFWQSFVSNLLATALGAGLGILGALWLSNYLEKRTEKERKKKILTLLKDELSYNEIEFDRMDNVETVARESGILSSILRNELWRAYSDGGELEWIKDEALLAKIADTYYSIRAVMFLSDRYYDSVQFATEEASKERTNRTIQVISTLMEALEYGKKSIKVSIKLIDETLQKS